MVSTVKTDWSQHKNIFADSRIYLMLTTINKPKSFSYRMSKYDLTDTMSQTYALENQSKHRN